jgi:hypothetical protein
MLGKFLGGMPNTVEQLAPPPPRRDRFGNIKEKKPEPEDDKKKRWVDDREYADGEYAYNDMTRQAVWALQKEPVGTKVVVCPACKTDVEPVFSHNEVVEKNADKWFSAKMLSKTIAFARCEKCNLLYLAPELVTQRSFRLPMPNEDTSKYHCFLRETFTRVNPRDLFGKWVWVHDFLVQPCGFGDVTGKTFEDLKDMVITMDDVREAEGR